LLDTLCGILVYQIFDYGYNKILHLFFGLEPLVTYDMIMLQDDDLNKTTVIGAALFEKFDYREMQKWILERSKDLPRARHRLYKFMGNWYFKKIPDEEFKEMEDWFIKEVNGIHTEKELAEFMCQEQMKREPSDLVQFRFFCLPNYKDDESILILKCCHWVCDGQACGAFLNALNQNPKAENTTGIKPLSFIMKLLITITLPWTLLKVFCKLIFPPADKNAFRTRSKVSGQKKGAFIWGLKV